MGVAHQPVMVEEVLAALAPSADGVFLDCTYGRGGHARALLSALGSGGVVIALDRDPDAMREARVHAAREPRLRVVHAPFSQLGAVAEAHGVKGAANGVLLDLGVSSPQLDDPSRGFSFQTDGPLDMRMDSGAGASAAEWIASAGEKDIADVLWRFGEERHSRRIAKAICQARRTQPIRTTRELASVVESAVPHPARRRNGRGRAYRHPATRTFQAIRIFVNDEIRELDVALLGAVDVLAPGGRLAVISFHSLEDRTVKRFMRNQARGGRPGDEESAPGSPTMRVVGRAVRPTEHEVASNPRSRSASLRVAEKLG
ncbi:MAG: 16S rRNA (cytosine(1402)-N(4))-methyltransferase RsmH [Gammaproteobacteria bacterium]|nr:16S rRNA (cytosine(1402)-N(4))-methyltransferase RsmH [Gammaproteobacteria bacterium]